MTTSFIGWLLKVCVYPELPSPFDFKADPLDVLIVTSDRSVYWNNGQAGGHPQWVRYSEPCPVSVGD